MFTQATTHKRKPRGFPSSVEQGSRILGQTGGRPAQMYLCEKAHGICPAESPLEKTIGQLAGLDPYVLSNAPQPFTIDVVSGELLRTPEERKLHRMTRDRSDARQREYTPDFCFNLIDGRRIVVEVKDPRFPCKEEYWRKVEKAKELLRARGYHFQVISMVYAPSAPLVHNADLLAAFQRNFKKTITQSQLSAIETGLGDAVSSLGHVAQLAGLSLREAPALVLHGVVAADISIAPLGASTPVWLAHGDLEHLAVLEFIGDTK
ncbi:hypothetical protein [Massilia eburnea]|uniref:hypothetical protein n=1 Tax=Massilia eburnea TaxID=1776165 RepID=UPI003D6B06F0